MRLAYRGERNSSCWDRKDVRVENTCLVSFFLKSQELFCFHFIINSTIFNIYAFILKLLSNAYITSQGLVVSFGEANPKLLDSNSH